jgi:hypothetical protein
MPPPLALCFRRRVDPHRQGRVTLVRTAVHGAAARHRGEELTVACVLIAGSTDDLGLTAARLLASILHGCDVLV